MAAQLLDQNEERAAISRRHARRAFVTVLLIELWERFGYYGIAVLLVLFMVQKLGLDDTRVNLIWGAFSALIFAAPAVGGWIGDRVLGARRCLVLGGSTLALGYLLLSLSGDKLSSVLIALSVIIVGNALFKANAANMVRRVYEGVNTRIDSAFTLYYMTNNIAATVAVLLTPWIKDHWSWHVAFAVCCAGLIIGLLHYAFMARTLGNVGSLPDLQPLRKDRLALVLCGGVAALFIVIFVLQHSQIGVDCVYAGAAVVLGIFCHMIMHGARHERAGLIAALILLVEASLFYIFYQQLATSLTLFALRNVDWNQTLFGHHLFNWSPAQYAAVNAIWIMLLSPVLAWMYRRLGQRDLPIAAKFAIGFAAVAAGFFTFGLSEHIAVDGKVPSWIMILGYGFYSLGELLVAALGLAMISRYVPARMGGFMMGAFFVAAGVAEYLGSVIANLANVSGHTNDPLLSLPVYTRLFYQLGYLALAGAVIAVALLPLIKRLSLTHEKSQPVPAKQAVSPTMATR
jgi:proton-dependent oligopeptide transporter, POT family